MTCATPVAFGQKLHFKSENYVGSMLFCSHLWLLTCLVICQHMIPCSPSPLQLVACSGSEIFLRVFSIRNLY